MADEFDDGWMRGIRLIDLEVGDTLATVQHIYMRKNAHFKNKILCMLKVERFIHLYVHMSLV